MRCEYGDGLRLSYCGPVRINKEGEINVFVEPEEIPANIQSELLEATLHENCNEMRNIADEIIDTFGTKFA